MRPPDIARPSLPGVEPDIPELPVCSLGQVTWEDDRTLQWELRLVVNAEVAGFVEKAVEAYVHGPQPSEKQLVMIQPSETFDTDRGAAVGLARGVQWWKSAPPLYCKVVNTGPDPGVVGTGHPIAKVIALDVRDVDRFRALFIHLSLIHI